MSKKNIPAAVGLIKLFQIVLFSVSVGFSYSGLSIIKKGNTWEYYSISKSYDLGHLRQNRTSITILIVDTVYSVGNSPYFNVTESDSGYDSAYINGPIKIKETNQYVYYNDSIYYLRSLTGNDSGEHFYGDLLLLGYKFSDSVSLVLYGSDTLHLDSYTAPPFCGWRVFQTLENYGLIYHSWYTSGCSGMTYQSLSSRLISFNHVLFDTTKLRSLATPIEHVPLVSERSCSLRAWTNNTGVSTIYLPDHATPVSLSVFDIRGRKIQQFDRIAENAFQWDCGQLHGLYVVKAMIDGKVQTAKIAPAK
jgi:hypothetical protein